jgi:hypothetical protein
VRSFHLPMSRRTPSSNKVGDLAHGGHDAAASDLTNEAPIRRVRSSFQPSAKSLRASCIVVVAIIVLSFASAPLLHLGQRAIGYRRTPLEQRAWLVQPEQVGGNGIARGHTLQFDISIPSPRPISWSERTDGVQIASGVVTGRAGSIAHVTVKTTAARNRNWITIWIGGIDIPLKVWVAS